MNLIDLQRALKQLRLGGVAAVLETRLHQAQTEPMAPIDLISCLVCDELSRRSDRLLGRRRKAAQFRDPQVTLDNFDFNFNKKMNRSLVFDLDRKSTRLNSSHSQISYAVFCLKKKNIAVRNCIVSNNHVVHRVQCVCVCWVYVVYVFVL